MTPYRCQTCRYFTPAWTKSGTADDLIPEQSQDGYCAAKLPEGLPAWVYDAISAVDANTVPGECAAWKEMA